MGQKMVLRKRGLQILRPSGTLGLVGTPWISLNVIKNFARSISPLQGLWSLYMVPGALPPAIIFRSFRAIIMIKLEFGVSPAAIYI